MNRIRLTAKHKYKPASSYFTVVAAILLLTAAMPARSLDFSTSTIDDSSPDTGWFASLAIDQNGTLHAAYYDLAGGDVLYSRKTLGSGWSEPINIEQGDDPAHVSIAVGVDGSVHVAFYNSGVCGVDNGGLCHAKSSDGETWIVENVEGDEDVNGFYTSIAVDASGNPHIAYAGFADELKYAKHDGVSWSTQTVDANAILFPDKDLDEDYSRQVSMALDGAGNPHIAYYDDASGELEYTSFDGSDWSIPEPVVSTGAVLMGVSLALDGSGAPYVSCANYDTYLELWFSSKTAGSWSSVVVVPEGEFEPGVESSLVLDGDAHPNIAFPEFNAYTLLYAWHDGMSWSTQTVEIGGVSAAWYVSLALDGSGDPHFIYGSGELFSDMELKYASATATGFTPPMGGNNGSKVHAPTGFHADAVNSSSISWSWTDNSLSGADPGNELGFRLYGAYSSTGPFTLIKGTDTIEADVTSYNETGLTSGTTYFRYIAAVNTGGVVTSSGALVVTAAGESTEETAEVTPDAPCTITATFKSRDVEVHIPQATFPETVNVTVKLPASVPSPSPRLAALPTPVTLEIVLSNPSLQPMKDVTITMSYLDGDIGSLNENKFILARYDTSHSAWVPLSSTRDTVNNKVTAKTNHLSVFQIMHATLANTLAEVTIGPNPFRPSRNPGQDMTFRNLPARARVRIYTYLGELLYDTNEDGTGIATWNGRNKSGKQVASGVYIAFIEGAGGKKTFKVALER